MRILKAILPAIALFCSVCSASAQDGGATGKICFVRHTGYNGAALNFHCFIDSSLVCDLKNNRYSEHEVPAGDHIVNVRVYSRELKSPKHPVTVKVEAGQTYYIKILPETAYGIDSYVKTMSVSEATIRAVKKKTKLQTECL